MCSVVTRARAALQVQATVCDRRTGGGVAGSGSILYLRGSRIFGSVAGSIPYLRCGWQYSVHACVQNIRRGWDPKQCCTKEGRPGGNRGEGPGPAGALLLGSTCKGRWKMRGKWCIGSLMRPAQIVIPHQKYIITLRTM